MRTILVGDCSHEHLFGLADPDAPTEAEFELLVVKALGCAYPAYRCIEFRGTFRLDNRSFQSDLALVARDLSHWFVIEVELVSHSFKEHVLPQVRSFRYGRPEVDCIALLAKSLDIERQRAATLVNLIPYGIAVVANRRDSKWDVALGSHGIQLLTVAAFRSVAGIEALEIDGVLEVVERSVGFGEYSALDSSLKFAKGTLLPAGDIQLNDPMGSVASWRVTHAEDVIWARKIVGSPSLPNEALVQIIRTVGGRLSMRMPT